MEDGELVAGFSVVVLIVCPRGHTSPRGASAQRAERMALTWAPRLAVLHRARYTFTALHTREAFREEKVLTNAGGKDVSMAGKPLSS